MELVDTYGKDWKKIAELHSNLHKRDRTDEELKMKYKNIKRPNTRYTMPYQMKMFREKKVRESAEDWAAERDEHYQKHEHKKAKHEKIMAIIKDVEEREIIAKTSKKRSAEEMAEQIEQGATTRKKARAEKEQRIKNLAEAESKQVDTLLDFLAVAKLQMERNNNILNILLLILTQQNPAVIPLVQSLNGAAPAVAGPSSSPQPTNSRQEAELIAQEVLCEGMVCEPVD